MNKVFPGWIISLLYAEWSEETHAASFLSPTESTVREFRAWLDTKMQREPTDYEARMVGIYTMQERVEVLGA